MSFLSFHPSSENLKLSIINSPFKNVFIHAILQIINIIWAYRTYMAQILQTFFLQTMFSRNDLFIQVMRMIVHFSAPLIKSY